jgi:hypothetical protein
MQVSQYGLSDCFKRAYNTIYLANLASGMSQSAATAEAQNAVLSQSYLRLEQPLTINNSVFNFPILANTTGNSNPVRATEVRLNQQDSFFCSSISIYLTVAASATATNFELQTYPNPVTFTLGGAAPAPLNTFYNGFVQITINKSVIVPNYPLTNFYQIPQTQLTAAANSPQTQFDPSEVSLWEPNINFVGTKNSQINLQLPSNISAIDNFTYAVVIIQGILAQNVTLMS